MLIKERLETMTPKELDVVKTLWPELFDHSYVRHHVYGHGKDEVVEIDRYRDYNPDIIFWIDATNIDMMWNDNGLIPLPNHIPHDGKMSWIQGKFWLDEWGNANFKPKIHKEARHYLIKNGVDLTTTPEVLNGTPLLPMQDIIKDAYHTTANKE